MTRDGTVRRGPKIGITERGEAARGENAKFSEVMEDHILERDQMKERFSVKKSITKGREHRKRLRRSTEKKEISNSAEITEMRKITEPEGIKGKDTLPSGKR